MVQYKIRIRAVVILENLYIYFYNRGVKMLTKIKVAALVEHMPDTFSVDDLVERVLLLQKIEQAQKEIEDGEGMDWEDFKKEMEQWWKL